jgi:hypothetical protein
MPSFRTALKEALAVFVFSRLTILILTYLCVVLLPQVGGGFLNCTHGIHPNPCLLSWYRWDSQVYVRIAFQGYASPPDVVFYPLWPLLLHVGGLLAGGFFPVSYYLAGLLLSNICFYFALVLLYCLLSEEFEPSLAKRALFYVAFYPYALFFFAGYSESLFVLLCIAFFLVLRRGKPLDWWLAGGIGCLSALNRPTGVLLCLPFLVVYVQRFWFNAERDQYRWFQKVNALAPIALIPAGLLLYAMYLGHTRGNPFIIQTEEAVTWNRHFVWIWTTYHRMLKILFTSPLFSLDFVKDLLDLTFTTLPVVALLISWKRLPLHYSIFALAAFLFSISYPLGTVNPMAAQPRYIMSIFPFIVVFAIWGKWPHVDRLLLALWSSLLAFNCILFISHYWVA